MTDTTEQAKAHFFEGNAHFEAERFEQALASFQAALALVPGRPSILSNLGMTQVHLGQWAAAVDTLTQATQADPANRDAWLARAHAHQALLQWAPALEALQQALPLGPPTAALWLALARCQLRLERPAEALRAYEDALAMDATLAEAWSQRGSLLREVGQHEEAARSFQQALAHGGDDALNRFYLASVTHQPVPERPPQAYVEALFDSYADDFQTHLVEGLNYQAHRTLLASLVESGARLSLVLDLGCGTGLCGQLIHPQADAVDGVDVSSAMVAQARASGAYRQVVHGDLLAFLEANNELADLVMAADVFIYVGALEAVFAAVRQRLAPGGCFAFSVERAEAGQDLVLLPSLRYAHSSAYVERLAQANGLRVVRQWEAPLREDQRRPVMGLYFHLAPA
ncbi:MAG TPA: tetratricopeptide repeat protein [Hydrogenophaga sp.]|nr:tetratricopeptide repeat protein [Hydrogenophaga sp.]